MLEQYVPSASEPFDYARAAHLLRRIMTGPTDEEIRRAVSEGYETTTQRVFSRYEPSTALIEEFAGKDPQAAGPPPGPLYDAWFQIHVRHIEEFLGWWLFCILRSPVSLHERMVLFWHRHFPISVMMFPEYSHAYNVLLRQYAFGNFKELIKEMTKNTLMQLNLSLHDNYITPERSFINENYARELMELYTCGVFDEKGNRNYTQKDVHEAARALTGWFPGLSNLGDKYTSIHSRFIDNRWDSGTKTFLGRTGAWNSFDIIDILFEERQWQIATRMCGRMYRAFVCDTENKEIVHALARILIDSGWEVEPVLRTLIGSRHFFHDDNVAVLKKSHIEFVLGLLRQLDANKIPDMKIGMARSGDLIFRLRRWGEIVNYPPNVSGWVGGRDWVNASVLSRRLQFAQDLMFARVRPNDNSTQSVIYTLKPSDLARRFEESQNAVDFVTALIRHLLPVSISEQDRKIILDALLDGGKEYEWDLDNPVFRADDRIRKCLAAIANHPAFQLY